MIDGNGVVPELAREQREESHATSVGERAVRVGDRRHVGPPRCRVVALEQPGDHRTDSLRITLLEIGSDLERGPMAAAARAAAPESVEETTGWHSATIVHPPCAMH